MIISLEHQDQPLVKKQAPQFMDVVLLDPKTTVKKEAAKDAKVISNRSAKGGSSKATDRTTRSAKSPMPGLKQQRNKPAPPPALKSPPPKPKASVKKDRIIATNKSQKSSGLRMQQAPVKKKPQVKPVKPKYRPIPLSNLLPSSMALSELSRDFEREKRMKQMLSKEADIPINTKEAKYAPYAHSLVRSLEEQWRPGQADYQKFAEHARQVLMRVTIELNGELGNLEILRPSPIASLNESAIEAIHAAAPFKPLPSSWGLDRASFYLTFEVVEDKFVFRAM
ncbi:MAG: TonB family protein [Mariprofundaceae bacterium]